MTAIRGFAFSVVVAILLAAPVAAALAAALAVALLAAVAAMPVVGLAEAVASVRRRALHRSTRW